MNKITKILAEEIKDSRGNPTIKVMVWVGEKSGSFSVPSGASTGAHEAHELRDQDGKGVKNAIEKVDNEIAPLLVGQDVLDQKEIDKIMLELDGTTNKNNLGGNAIVAAKVSSLETFEYLRTLAEIKPSRRAPYLFMNLLEGGKHTSNTLSFQEYHIVPDIENVSEAVEIGIKIQNSLKEIISKELGEESLVLGDEGGFAPKVSDIRKPLEFLAKAIKGNNLEQKVQLALDVAASSFFSGGKYKIDSKEISKEELLEIYNSLIEEFNLFSIEDPFEEEDFESFRKLKENQKDLMIVGDDLTVTNVLLLQKAIEKGSINAIIIKPNQIGTLTETLETMKLAREHEIELIISHRSGETDDDFIADLAYAFGCFGLKAGSPQKAERMIKYKRLIQIQDKF
ncbi:MAG: Enolase [Candidatus Nomurabacteria bacterium GW2011_GWC2_35_35]|nr:MAG: Enolase [Candidatus Nomurabacteria bacterium GW2011_GWC2_35_35]